MVSTLFEEANAEAEMLAAAEEREREQATVVVKFAVSTTTIRKGGFCTSTSLLTCFVAHFKTMRRRSIRRGSTFFLKQQLKMIISEFICPQPNVAPESAQSWDARTCETEAEMCLWLFG